MTTELARIEHALHHIAAPDELDRAHPIVIYGAGGCGRNVSAALVERGFTVVAFLDQNARGQLVDGVLCLHPSDTRTVQWREEATIIIGVWNYTADVSAIEAMLKAQGWNRVLSFPDFFEIFAPDAGEGFWLAPRSLYREESTLRSIEEAAKLWHDEESRELFVRAIEARVSGELLKLNEPLQNRQPQYFPDDIAGWPQPQRFVDCGAFDGDTLRELPATTRTIAAFEPDAKNFRALSNRARMAQESTLAESTLAESTLLLWPCGVWSETTQLSFSSDGAASRGQKGGETVVPVVALDDVLMGFAPDFIKMDIEGAEPDALRGARRIISEHRPALAICVYHRAAHLWQILLELHSWDLGYDFFLRAHGFNGFDWVLYARPAASDWR